MNANNVGTVAGVFYDSVEAQDALAELRAHGFTNDQIGVARRGGEVDSEVHNLEEGYTSEGAAAGVAAGAGLGALWGVGIIAGVMPVLGPALAGGTLAIILSSAAAGAAAAGLTGALIGMGIPKEEAEFYETEFHAGRIIVTVQALGREAEASEILLRHGAFNHTSGQPLSHT